MLRFKTIRFMTIGWVIAAGFWATEANAFMLDVHGELTKACLRAMGWRSSRAIERVIEANIATDIARVPGPWQYALWPTMPKIADFVPLVREMAEHTPREDRGTLAFHFNSLYSFDAVASDWADMDTWLEDRLDELRDHPPGARRERRTIAVMGLVAHAVQDFYVHSNWVWLLSDSIADNTNGHAYPLWEDLMEPDSAWLNAHPKFDREAVLDRMRVSNQARSTHDREGGLQTGRILGDPASEPKPWRHRHPKDEWSEAREVLAIRSTALWIERIETTLGYSPWRHLPTGR